MLVQKVKGLFILKGAYKGIKNEHSPVYFTVNMNNYSCAIDFNVHWK